MVPPSKLVFNSRIIPSTWAETLVPFSLNLCESPEADVVTLIPLLDLNHVSLSTVIKLLFDETMPSNLVVPVTWRSLVIPTDLLNVETPVTLRLPIPALPVRNRFPHPSVGDPKS